MSAFAFTRSDIMRGIELLVMGLLSLLVLLFVVRPLVRRIITPEQRTAARPEALSGSAASGLAPDAREEASLVPGPSQTAKMIDIAQVKGQVHAQAIQKVGELADRNPHETVAIIRQWLHDAPA
jgi:flagellar M-ring protein FliF